MKLDILYNKKAIQTEDYNAILLCVSISLMFNSFVSHLLIMLPLLAPAVSTRSSTIFNWVPQNMLSISVVIAGFVTAKVVGVTLGIWR